MLEAFLRVEIQAFKHVLGQVFQWYQRFSEKIKDIESREKDADLFNDNRSSVAGGSVAVMNIEKAAGSQYSSNLSLLNENITL